MKKIVEREATFENNSEIEVEQAEIMHIELYRYCNTVAKLNTY